VNHMPVHRLQESIRCSAHYFFEAGSFYEHGTGFFFFFFFFFWLGQQASAILLSPDSTEVRDIGAAIRSF
jgi:hypothetical protein